MLLSISQQCFFIFYSILIYLLSMSMSTNKYQGSMNRQRGEIWTQYNANVQHTINIGGAIVTQFFL